MLRSGSARRCRTLRQATGHGDPNEAEVSIFKHFLYCMSQLSRPAASRFCWRTKAPHTNGRADSTEPRVPGALTTRGKRQVLVLV